FTLLKPMHLLLINLITDTFPALALGMEEGEKDIMSRKPRKPNESIFAGGIGVNVVVQGVYVGLLTLFAFILGHCFEIYSSTGVWKWEFTFEGGFSNDGMTMAFLTLSMTEMFHAFNTRSINHSIFTMKKQNKFLWGAFILSFLLTTAVIYIPGVNTMFEFAPISFTEYLISIALAFTVIPFTEITKLIAYGKKNKLDKIQSL
ncbi:MAG: cation transporting ATPase C-terminal domain-containing protein, partial [Clostridia bacterium]|nr:cation transporting ATPase C-terminal domain-containing protein [Clostridia bacterium]